MMAEQNFLDWPACKMDYHPESLAVETGNEPLLGEGLGRLKNAEPASHP
jgi:hypothetical protein